MKTLNFKMKAHSSKVKSEFIKAPSRTVKSTEKVSIVTKETKSDMKGSTKKGLNADLGQFITTMIQ